MPDAIADTTPALTALVVANALLANPPNRAIEQDKLDVAACAMELVGHPVGDAAAERVGEDAHRRIVGPQAEGEELQHSTPITMWGTGLQQESKGSIIAEPGR